MERTPGNPAVAGERGRRELPGSGRWSVAVQDLGLVLVPGGGGAVRVQDQRPAASVDHDLVVEAAQEDAVPGAGVAAVGLVRGVVDFAGGGGLVAAARPAAVPVAHDDGVPDAGRDGGAGADVQRQAGPGEPGAELPAAQERRQPAGAGEQV